MSVKYALLGILSDRERHGYELKDEFEERIGEFWKLNYGQIYQTLDRLERDGLVERRVEPQERRPDRKVYRITPKGRDDLEHWLTKPASGPRALRDELFIKLLLLAPQDREAVLELIDHHREVYLEHMRKLTRRKFDLSRRPDRSDHLVTELLMDAALFHAEADVRWLTHCREKLLLGHAGDGEGDDGSD